MNVENKDGAGRGGGVGRSKIDREQWPDILARRHRGDSIAAIGRVYGVTPSAISYILKKAHADSEMPAPADAKIDPSAGEHNGTTANADAAPANGAAASSESNEEVSVTASSTPATTSSTPAPEAATPATSSQTAETGAGEPRRSRESGGEAAPRRLSSGTLSVNRESGRAKTRQTAEAAPGAQPPAAAQRSTAPAATGESASAAPASTAGASGPAQPTGQTVSAETGQSEQSQRLLTAANALAQSWDADASGDELSAKAHELRRALAAIEIADSKRSSRKRKAAEPPVEPEPPREAPGPREPLPLEEETETAPEGTSLGTIKFYKPSKGFGFVVPDDGGQDIYLAAEVVEAAGVEDLQTGDRVAVERGPGRKGEEVKSLQLVGS